MNMEKNEMKENKDLFRWPFARGPTKKSLSNNFAAGCRKTIPHSFEFERRDRNGI